MTCKLYLNKAALKRGEMRRIVEAGTADRAAGGQRAVSRGVTRCKASGWGTGGGDGLAALLPRKPTTQNPLALNHI